MTKVRTRANSPGSRKFRIKRSTKTLTYTATSPREAAWISARLGRLAGILNPPQPQVYHVLSWLLKDLERLKVLVNMPVSERALAQYELRVERRSAQYNFRTPAVYAASYLDDRIHKVAAAYGLKGSQGRVNPALLLRIFADRLEEIVAFAEQENGHAVVEE